MTDVFFSNNSTTSGHMEFTRKSKPPTATPPSEGGAEGGADGGLEISSRREHTSGMKRRMSSYRPDNPPACVSNVFAEISCRDHIRTYNNNKR